MTKYNTLPPTRISMKEEIDSNLFSKTVTSDAGSTAPPLETAIIYCEGSFGEEAGKTTSELVCNSGKFKILSVIDDEKAGQDTGKILNGEKNGIPIYRNLGTALAHAGRAPKHLIFGITPESGKFSDVERQVLLRAMKYGINIVNGLPELLNDDAEFKAACEEFGVTICDLQGPS